MDLLSIDQDILVLVKDGDELREFKSKIYAIHDEAIAFQLDDAETPPEVGADIEVIFTRPDAYYSIHTKLSEKVNRNSPLYVFNCSPQDIVRSQRRRFFRVAARLRVAFLFIGFKKGRREKVASSTFTKDISGGGLYCYIQRPLRVGEILPMEIFLPNEETPIFTKARVVRKEEIEKADAVVNAYGFNFEKIEENDRTKIIKYLNHLQSRLKPL